MPKARKAQIALESTPYYHCISRCVRRAFLCGEDRESGRSFEHRRGWIEDEILRLAGIFAIDVAAYAVMSNHYHVVLYIDRESAEAWDGHEVVERWHSLFKGNLFSQRFALGETLDEASRLILSRQIAEWRARLHDISWFMRVLNEKIARQANKEDGCTGRFWEGRFKSQALLDEKALIACMAYVDLNPIRAKMVETPETSEHTSIKQRVEVAQTGDPLNSIVLQQPEALLPFAGNPRNDMPAGLPFRLVDYLELVDWTGRAIREGKPGAIAESLPPILSRLGFESKQWLYLTQHYESGFKGLVGTLHALKRACRQLGLQRMPGRGACVSGLGRC